MTRGNLFPSLVVTVLLAAGGLFAWMTQNPSAAWIEEAESWPVVGSAAEAFRTAYLGRPRPAPGPREPEEYEGEPIRLDFTDLADAPASGALGETSMSGDSPAKQVTVRRYPAESGQPSEPLDLRDDSLGHTVVGREPSFTTRSTSRLQIPERLALEERWLLPGQPLFSSPDSKAEPVLDLPALAVLPVYGMRDSWVQVVYEGRELWGDTTWKPPHSRRKARRGGLRHRFEPVKASDSHRLKAIRQHLGGDRSERRLGAYTLYTDVEDPELLAFLDASAHAAEAAYFSRYARLPAGNPKRTIVLFARRADYLEYSEDSPMPSSLQHAGHAGRGILAFFAEGRSRQDLAATLVHEITHLLNTRALTQFLPPWLSEGLASDLGAVDFEQVSDGSLLFGFDVSVMQLAATLEEGQLPPSAKLMALERETFYQGDIAAWSYAHAGALVRYLGTKRYREGFRSFLKRVADGRGADTSLLLDQLGTDAASLDEGFHEWIVERSRAAAAAANERLVNRAATSPGLVVPSSTVVPGPAPEAWEPDASAAPADRGSASEG